MTLTVLRGSYLNKGQTSRPDLTQFQCDFIIVHENKIVKYLFVVILVFSFAKTGTSKLVFQTPDPRYLLVFRCHGKNEDSVGNLTQL